MHAIARLRVGVDARARPCAFARVALLIQHATRFRHIVRSLAGCTIFFRRYVIKGTIFKNKVTERKMCVLIFSTNFI